MSKRTATEVKHDLLTQLPVQYHVLVEELDAHRRYAWSRYFRTKEQLDALKAKKG